MSVATEAKGSSLKRLVDGIVARKALISPLMLFTMIMAIVFAVIEPRFAASDNLVNVLRQNMWFALLVLGQLFVMVSGSFDVSQGSVAALSGVVAAIVAEGWGTDIAIMMAVFVGVIVGLANGAVVSRFKCPSFIVTLGTMYATRGVALIVTGGLPVINVPKGYSFLGTYSWNGIPVQAMLIVMIYAAAWIVLNRTKFGRHVYAVGGNIEAARLCGIETGLVQMLTFIISGALCGLAGFILSSRVNSGHATIADGSQMQAIAALVVGGVSMRGGEGGLISAIFGLVVLSLLSNGLNLANVSSYVQQVVVGGVLVAALVWEQVRKAKGHD